MKIFSMFLPRPLFTDSQRYKDALNWYECWKPNDEVDYAEVKDLAIKEYESTEQNFAVLDRKAAWMISLESTLTIAMIGFAEKVGFKYEALVPAVVLLFLAIWAGLRSRLPVYRPAPMEIVDTIDVRDYSTQNEFNGILASSYHCNVAGMKIISSWKASLIRQSGYLFFAAFVYTAIAGLFR